MKSWIKKIIFLLSAALTAGCTGTPPSDIGISNGRLAECPDRPNCAASQTASPKHKVPPLEYAGDREQAFAALRLVLENQPGTEIIEQSNQYIRAESRSKIFKFVDDVEFFFPETGHIIHVRSASRLGYSDFGVNAKRIERIRSAFQAELAGQTP